MYRDSWLCHRRTEELLRHEIESASDIEIFSRQQLAATLRSASRKIPAYRGFAEDASVDNAYEVLGRFPVVDKEDLLKHSELYSAPRKYRYFGVIGKTSGTSGTPLTMMRSFDSIIWERAFFARMFRSSGVPPKARRALLRGDHVVPFNHDCPPFWFHNLANRQLVLSTRHLKPGFLPYYIDELKRFRPAMLEAYPSAAAELANWLEQTHDYLDIPHIFLGSEPVYPTQRMLIEERLRGKVFETYGMAERVALANECGYGNLHIAADYSHVEILDEEGKPTDGWGFVTGTTYFNHLMPLVRYKLSDITRWKKGTCPCGKPFPMVERITGRLADRIYGHDGGPVSQTLITFGFKGVSHIRLAQVAQLEPDLWEIRIVPFPEFNQDDEKQLIKNFREKVEPLIRLKIVIMDDLPRMGSGKFRWVVNEIETQSQ
jgi:phenylacetate-CoA ligase